LAIGPHHGDAIPIGHIDQCLLGSHTLTAHLGKAGGDHDDLTDAFATTSFQLGDDLIGAHCDQRHIGHFGQRSHVRKTRPAKNFCVARVDWVDLALIAQITQVQQRLSTGFAARGGGTNDGDAAGAEHAQEVELGSGHVFFMFFLRVVNFCLAQIFKYRHLFLTCASDGSHASRPWWNTRRAMADR